MSLSMFTECVGFNENGSHRSISLSTWFPGDGTVWEGLGGVASLKGGL